MSLRVTLSGSLSLQVEDEWLFEGRAVPVLLRTVVAEEGVVFVDNKAHLTIDVPVDLKISEREWSRAIGELIARHLSQTADDTQPAHPPAGD